MLPPISLILQHMWPGRWSVQSGHRKNHLVNSVQFTVYVLLHNESIEKGRTDNINYPENQDEEVFRNVSWKQQEIEITSVYMPKKRVQEEREN